MSHPSVPPVPLGHGRRAGRSGAAPAPCAVEGLLPPVRHGRALRPGEDYSEELAALTPEARAAMTEQDWTALYARHDQVMVR